MKIVTHSDSFHLDDLFAVAATLIKYPDAEVIRSREPSVVEQADIVIDVGQVLDPDKLRFDHHMPGGAGSRENGIPYASFGLVWKEWGAELSGTEEVAKLVEEKLVMPIDAKDNGVEISKPIFENIRDYTISDYIYSFNTESDSEEDLNKTFFQVLPIAQDLLRREIKTAQVMVREWVEVKRIYDMSDDKEVIVLPIPMAWKKVLIPTEAKFIVSQRLDGTWQARAVPAALGSFEVKKPLPNAWAGLEGEALAKVTGVEDATFCHKNSWLAGAQTKEGALELAHKALNA